MTTSDEQALKIYERKFLRKIYGELGMTNTPTGDLVQSIKEQKKSWKTIFPTEKVVDLLGSHYPSYTQFSLSFQSTQRLPIP